MNPQKEFDTALSNLTTQERATYTKANPNVNVGGVQQSLTNDGIYSPITSESMKSQTPITVTDPAPATGYTGLGAATEAVSKGYTAQQQEDSKRQAEIASQETKTEKLKTTLMEKLFGAKTETGEKDKAYTDTVDPAKRELDVINQQIIQEEVSARRQVEELRKTFQGTTGGLNDAIRAVERDSASKRADLAVIQLAKQNNYFGAKEIADRKIQADLEQDRNEIAALKFGYEANKESFDKKEQRQYEEMLDRKNREADAREKELENISDLSIEALKKGAPPSIAQKMRRADSVAEAIGIGGSYLTEALTKTPVIQKINGVDLQWNPTTGKWETPSVTDAAGSSSPVQLAQAQGNVESITQLLGDSAIRTAVGPTGIARFVGRGFDTVTGNRQNFISSVEQIRSNLNLESLIQAKSRGATFGALSDQELRVLASAATKIGTWAIKDKDGNVTGYRANEKDFKAELDKINNFAKLDYIVRGGDPTDVGAQLMPDGTIWSTNSDGTYTQIK